MKLMSNIPSLVGDKGEESFVDLATLVTLSNQSEPDSSQFEAIGISQDTIVTILLTKYE